MYSPYNMKIFYILLVILFSILSTLFTDITQDLAKIEAALGETIESNHALFGAKKPKDTNKGIQLPHRIGTCDIYLLIEI